MPKAPTYPKFPATLQAVPESIRPEEEMSVSEQTRLAREALARPAVRHLMLRSSMPVPVTGQYYDAIRAGQQVRTNAPKALTNAQVRGVFNKAGGVKSFAAANYNYPSGQMVIGAALAGVSASPSEDRKRQMARLMGLGASERIDEAANPIIDGSYAAPPLQNYDAYAVTDASRPGDRFASATMPPAREFVGWQASFMNPANQRQTGLGSPTRAAARVKNFSSGADALVAAYCDIFYSDTAENNRRCGTPNSVAPWMPGGDVVRGIPARGQYSDNMLNAVATKTGSTTDTLRKTFGLPPATTSPAGDGFYTQEMFDRITQQIAAAKVEDLPKLQMAIEINRVSNGRRLSPQQIAAAKAQILARQTGTAPEKGNTAMLVVGAAAVVGLALFMTRK